jgi:class 3 adenylate cyclase
MSDLTSVPQTGPAVRVELEPYTADLQLSSIPIGIDNIHYDVYLSPRFVEFSRRYILDLIRHAANLQRFFGSDTRIVRQAETGNFKRMLADLLQAGLTRAKFEKNVEIDILLRLSLLKHLTQETAAQFANSLLECKEWIRSRGEFFERSERAHLLKAQLAELQSDRRRIYRQVGQQIWQMIVELDDTILSRTRKALFGEDFAATYELLKNRLIFVEGGKDDHLFLENYVLLGNFQRDPDRFETLDALFLDFMRDTISAGELGERLRAAMLEQDELTRRVREQKEEIIRLEEQRTQRLQSLMEGEGFLAKMLGRPDPEQVRRELEQMEKQHAQLLQQLDLLAQDLEAAKARVNFLREEYDAKLGDFLNQPENARRLFDSAAPGLPPEEAARRAQLLGALIARLGQFDLLYHILASYELRNVHLDYCPPVHLQQLKRALVIKEELKLVENILKQFPARQASLQRIADLSKAIRKYSPEQVRAVAVRFAEDFMRLRRDLRNAQRLTALLERVNLIQVEKTRELSRANSRLEEYLLPDEARPAEDRVVTHTVIKADVRGSTTITKELLSRGLNPASHFSLNFYEPVKRILDQYGAFKVFLEGDAIILAIYETESNRAGQRPVAKACLLAREMLAVAQSYNSREQSQQLPRLDLGVGIAYQASPPTIWADGDSRIMISRALNLSDRLSGCSKVARRILSDVSSPFNVFLFQTVAEEAGEEEIQELLIRYNMNGIELNGEGFGKLADEISLTRSEMDCQMPWGTERVQFFFGEVPMGDRLHQIIVRKGLVRQLLGGGKIGGVGTHFYYEVCTGTRFAQFLQEKMSAAVAG